MPTRIRCLPPERALRSAIDASPGEHCSLGSVLGNPRQVDVRDEVVVVSALDDDNLQGVVPFHIAGQRDNVTNELGAEEVHRRSCDLREQHRTFGARGDGLQEASFSFRPVRAMAAADSRRRPRGTRWPSP
jgi:hypothetical protein